MKRPKIDIDFKELFLSKGDRIAFGAAGAICLILLVVGVLTYTTSGKPEDHANALNTLVDKKRTEINNVAIPDGLGKISDDLTKDKKADRIDPMAEQLHVFPVAPRPGDDGMRRMPRIFLPADPDWIVSVGFYQINSLIFDSEEKREKVYVVEGGPDVKKDTTPQLDKNLLKRPDAPKGSAPPPPRTNPLFKDIKPIEDKSTGTKRLPGQLATDAEKVGTLRLLPVEGLESQKGARLAEQVLPVRMAIVVGAFPMRQQYQEYIDALKFADLQKLTSDQDSLPVFEEILVQRQAFGSDGKADGDYVDVDLGNQIRNLLVHTRKQIEADDSKFQDLIFDGLVTPRPALMSKKSFPKMEYPDLEGSLGKLQKTLADLKSKGQPKIEKIRPKLLTDASGINPFNAKGGEAKSSASAPPPGSGSGSLTPEEAAAIQLESIPEYALFRFIDTDLEPGKTYQYRVKLKVKNPNFEKAGEVAEESQAKEKSIYSGGSATENWYVIPHKAYVPHEFQVYVAPPDEKPASGAPPVLPANRDQVNLQIHRWIDHFFPNPKDTQEASRATIGDWVIGKRELYYRGESLKRTERLEVPIFNTLIDNYSLAVDNPKSTDKKAPVTIGPEDKKAEAMLVDFEGGKTEYKFDEAVADLFKDKIPGGVYKPKDPLPLEALILGPDGKLLSCSNFKGKANEQREKERDAHVKSFEEKVEKLKPKGSGSKGSGSFLGSGS
jgi:hypothetical protein